MRFHPGTVDSALRVDKIPPTKACVNLLYSSCTSNVVHKPFDVTLRREGFDFVTGTPLQSREGFDPATVTLRHSREGFDLALAGCMRVVVGSEGQHQRYMEDHQVSNQQPDAD